MTKIRKDSLALDNKSMREIGTGLVKRAEEQTLVKQRELVFLQVQAITDHLVNLNVALQKTQNEIEVYQTRLDKIDKGEFEINFEGKIIFK